MAIDNVFVHLISEELKVILLNAKVDNIKQIDKEAFLFSVHAPSGSLRLLFNCSPASARVCITENTYSYSDKPTNFMLLLKKHLIGMRVSGIEQINNDRILRFSFSGFNQFGDERTISLYSELIGNNTNLIICENNDIIIDCLKKKEYSEKTMRAVLPGLLYRLPPSADGIVLPGVCIEQIKAESSSYGDYPSFFSDIRGISSKIKAEFSGYTEFYDFLDYLNHGQIKFYCYYSERQMIAVSYYPLKSCSELEMEVFNSASEAFDFFYRRLDFEQKNSSITKKLSGTITVYLQRKRKKLVRLQSDLAACSDKDRILADAELLKANLYSIHKGDRYVSCIDYFSDDLCERVIEIDPTVDPSAYLSSLYKKYSKYKTAETVLASEIEKCRFEIEYLESVLEEISRAFDDSDVSEIKNELVSSGYLKKKESRTSRKEKSISIFRTPAGKTVYVGKNNLQNDQLTFKKASKNDLWFHVKDLHGSHVILQAAEDIVTEEDILSAAELAAYYSQARNSGKTAVDYTKVANVRRNSPYYPGRVLYTGYKTVIVSSDTAPKNNKSG